MRLRITTPPGDHFMKGYMASVFLDDVDVSQHVQSVVLTVESDGPIRADVRLYVTEVDCDVPALITTITPSGE